MSKATSSKVTSLKTTSKAALNGVGFFKSGVLRATLFLAMLLLLPFAAAQSVSLEAGLGYVENRDAAAQQAQAYDANVKVGVRVTTPLSRTVGIYVHPFLLDGFGVDAGAWFNFPVTPDDVPGLRSYLGAGLTVVRTGTGVALSAGLGYEIARNTEVVVVYTHRPLLLPELSQVFDVSLGVKFDFD